MAANALAGLTVPPATTVWRAAGAALTGSPRDFFLPGVYLDAAYAVALATSVVAGHPLIGHGYALLFGHDDIWRRDRRLRRAFAMTTLGWSAISAVRAGPGRALPRRATPGAHPGESPHGGQQPLKAEAATAATRAP